MSGPRTQRSAKKLAVPTVAPKRRVLAADIRQMIESARQQVAQAVNAGLTTLYWQIGTRIRQDILKQRRAEYGAEIVATLSRQLVPEFGRGFEEKNLRRMVQFAEVFDKVAGDTSKSLYDRNREVYELPRYGVKVKTEVGENTATICASVRRPRQRACGSRLFSRRDRCPESRGGSPRESARRGEAGQWRLHRSQDVRAGDATPD